MKLTPRYQPLIYQLMVFLVKCAPFISDVNKADKCFPLPLGGTVLRLIDETTLLQPVVVLSGIYVLLKKK